MSKEMVEFNPKDYKVETTKSWGSIGTIMDAKTLALRVCKELGLNPYGDEIALLNSSVGYKIYIKRAGLQKLITPRIARQYTDIIEIEKNGKDKSVILRVTIGQKTVNSCRDWGQQTMSRRKHYKVICILFINLSQLPRLGHK
jgi:hypothetical protein